MNDDDDVSISIAAANAIVAKFKEFEARIEELEREIKELKNQSNEKKKGRGLIPLILLLQSY
jgi:hypothetical protein